MASYILCPSCSNCIGDKYNVFLEIMEQIKKNKNQELIFTSEFYPEKLPEVAPLMDALDIKLTCCKTHILTVDTYSVVNR